MTPEEAIERLDRIILILQKNRAAIEELDIKLTTEELARQIDDYLESQS